MAGHPVALMARQQSRLTELAEEINKLKAGPAYCFRADATSKQEIDDAFTKIRDQFAESKTRIWGAVYNPGAFLRAPLLDVSEEQLRKMVDIQFFGAFFFCQAYLRQIEEKKGGAEGNGDEARGFLAFTGASASVKGSANFAAFSAAKFAVRSLAQSTAREYHPSNVHVCHVIVDGIIDTEVTQSLMGDKVSRSGAKHV